MSTWRNRGELRTGDLLIPKSNIYHQLKTPLNLAYFFEIFFLTKTSHHAICFSTERNSVSKRTNRIIARAP